MKILLVDDDAIMRRIGELTLRRHFSVLKAASGAEALRVAAAEQPSVVLLDVMMPGMDGKTTFAELKKLPATRSIPVIFMTAKVQRDEVLEYMNMGAKGVIAKPFDPEKLGQQILDMLGGHREAS